MPDYKQIFTETFETNAWQAESRSGMGSTLEGARHVIRELPILLTKLDIGSVLDIPCGDFMWMSKIDLSAIQYTGADIVDGIIAENNRRYASENIRFVTLDLARDPLPDAELILCRDCFIHLPNPLIFQSLENICRSSSRYLLTTNFTWRGYASNYPVDDIFLEGRRINLELAPFNLPYPITHISEGSNVIADTQDKCLALWSTEDIRGALKG